MAQGIKLGEAFVEVRARMNRLKQDLATARSRIAQFVANANKKLESLGQKLSSAGRAISTNLSLPLAGVAAVLLRFAGQAEETRNLVNVVFGDMADQAFAFGEQVKKSMGLSRIETLRNVATMHTMLKAMDISTEAAFEMSKALTTLAGDISSFREDISREEAFTILRAALSNEFEPLKRLGVVLNKARIEAFAFKNGIAETGKELTEAQAALATYGLIMEKTGVIQGDLTRTLGSFSNQFKTAIANFKDAAAALGEAFLPAATAVLRVINSIIGPMAEWIAQFLKAHPIIANTIAIVVGLTVVIGGLTLAIGALSLGLAAFAKVAAIAWAAFLGPLGLIVALIPGIIALIGLLTSNNKKERKKDADDAQASAQRIVDIERKKMQDIASIHSGQEFATGSGEALSLFGAAAKLQAAAAAPRQLRSPERFAPRSPSTYPDMSIFRDSATPLPVGGGAGGAAGKMTALLQQAVDELRGIRDQTMTPKLV